MGSKIVPVDWMREIVVSDFFSLLVPSLSRTQHLASPKVGNDEEDSAGLGAALCLFRA